MEQFTLHGNSYQLIKLSDKGVMFEATGDGGNNFYEVWIRLNDRWDKTQQFLHPSDEDFGVWAWSCNSLQKAERIFKEIESSVRRIRPMVES